MSDILHTLSYEEILNKKVFKDAKEIHSFIWDEVTSVWVSEYEKRFKKHGEIFLQTFEGYEFLIDMIWPYEEEKDNK